MTYKETTEYLYRQTPAFERVGASAYKPGLGTTEALDAHLGHPHRAYKTIHVAGTNGKGSTAHSIAAVLQAAGMRVGLYTSPHLVDFRERMRVNGRCVDEQWVVDFVERERPFFEPLHPSFFEVTTVMALKYFEEQRVDVAVVETGLGGRLDCTNIITPILSVITNISLDHTQFLGNTLAEIASEKAGIIKPGVPVVVGETTPETRPVFERRAQAVGAPIFFAEDEVSWNVECRMWNEDSCSTCVHDGQTALTPHSTLHTPQQTIRFSLKGVYQKHNLHTILCALTHLPLPIGEEAIREGLAHVCQLTGLRGRWETLCERPLTICDTGHNVAGWEYLTRQIKQQTARHKHIVFGMVDDKDIDTVLTLLPKDADYYFTQAHSKRAIPASTVREKAAQHGMHGMAYADVASAYTAARAQATDDDFIFIGGSSYIVADLLSQTSMRNEVGGCEVAALPGYEGSGDKVTSPQNLKTSKLNNLKTTTCTLALASCMGLLSACQESLEQRATREAREYTERYCPTPVENFTRTDSVVFEQDTHTYHYYCTLTERFDDTQVIRENKERLHEGILQGLVGNTGLKVYKDAGYRFAYTCHSERNPQQVLYEDFFEEKEYKR